MKQNYSLAMNGGEIFLELGDEHCSNRVENMKILDDSGNVLISFEDGEFFRHFYDEWKTLKKKQTFEKDHTFEFEYRRFIYRDKFITVKKKIVEKKRYEDSPEETITTTFYYRTEVTRVILTKIKIREKYFDRYERITENVYDSEGLKVVQSKEVYKDFYTDGITTTFKKYDSDGYIVEEKTDYKEME